MIWSSLRLTRNKMILFDLVYDEAIGENYGRFFQHPQYDKN